MLSVELNDEQIRELVREAIFMKLTDESKDALIAEAISHLFEVKKDGKRVTWSMQQAFRNAAEKVALELAEEVIREHCLPQLRNLMIEALSDSLDKTGREKITVLMARTLSESFSRSFNKF